MSQWSGISPSGGKTGWEWGRPQGHSGLVQGRPALLAPDLTHTWCWSASRWNQAGQTSLAATLPATKAYSIRLCPAWGQGLLRELGRERRQALREPPHTSC